MSTEVSKHLDRIEGAVDDIKTAITNRGVPVPNGAKIGDLAPLVTSISVQPRLQNKSVAPSHINVSVTADEGYDGLGTVTVTKIPLNYVDTSSGDAVASEILKDKKAWVDGSEVTGTMENRGAVTETLGMNSAGFFKEYAVIPAGYHNGNGRIMVIGQTRTVTPSDKTQQIFPTGGAQGSVLTKVTVNPIPSQYKDVTGANASADQVVAGAKFVGKNGSVEEGTMPTYDYTPMQAYYDSEDDTDYTFISAVPGAKYTVFEDEVYTKIPKSTFGDTNPMYVAEGHTFTSGDGVCIEGTMPTYDYSYVGAEYSDETDEGFAFWGILNGGAGAFVPDEINIEVPKEQFGNVHPANVPEGMTFTSQHGVCIEGEMPYYDYHDMEAHVYGAAEGYAFVESYVQQTSMIDDMVYSKIPLSDFGNAESKYVFKDKTFTSKDGYLVKGTMKIYDLEEPNAERHENLDTAEGFGFGVYPGYTNYFVQDYMYFRIQKDELGNAQPSDVRKGVTFTSSAGFAVEGTYEPASINTCTINVTFTTNAGNCLTSATTFANGAFSAFQSTTKSGTFTIQNVVCGSALSIGTTYPCTLYWSGSQQGHESLYGGMITVPATSGTYTVEVGVLDD